MILASLGILINATLSLLLLPKLTKEINFWKKLSIFFQWMFLPLTLIFFGSIPALDAQTRLALGKYLNFWSTEKFRK
jgi:hypothetical protein